MKHFTTMLFCLSLLVCGCSQMPKSVTGQAEQLGSSEGAVHSTPDVSVVKSYADKIEAGMLKEDVEKIIAVRGKPKENNPPHEQVFHYDYDNSYIQIVYSADFKEDRFSVLKKRHVVDNLTIQERNAKRHEAFSRWVQQRRKIMNRNIQETEKGSPDKAIDSDKK